MPANCLLPQAPFEDSYSFPRLKSFINHKNCYMLQMTKQLLILSVSLFCMMGLIAQNKAGMSSASSGDTTKKATKTSVADKVKSNVKMEGLLTLYQDTSTGSVQLYIRKDQLGKEFIYQSCSLGGPAQLFLNQNMIRSNWIFKIQKTFDRLEFSQENTNFYYDP